MNSEMGIGTLILTGYLSIFIFLLYSGSFVYSPETDFIVVTFIVITLISAISGIVLIPEKVFKILNPVKSEDGDEIHE